MRHSIREPWEGRKRFRERAFKVEAFRERYLAAMARLPEVPAGSERFEAQVKEVAADIRQAPALDGQDGSRSLALTSPRERRTDPVEGAGRFAVGPGRR